MYTVALTLSDGATMPCLSTVCDTDVEGELVFTTAYPGYCQSMTDPSYHGQILVFAFPCIGIYGLDREQFQSFRPWIKAVIIQRMQDIDGSLVEWLSEWGIPVVTGLDCRSLILKLRGLGTPMARISENGVSPVAVSLGADLIDDVSCISRRTYGDGPVSIALFDYGAKADIVRRLIEKGCSVTVLPHSVDSLTVSDGNFDGLVLSNGPGDPSVLSMEIAAVRGLLGDIPMFGICLGCQILALACGARTVRLPYGHRGANHPVMDLRSGKAIVTSQNHGYAVEESSLDGTGLKVTFRHLSDGTVEGIDNPDIFASGVQFHPEAGAGPLDGLSLFDEFVGILREE